MRTRLIAGATAGAITGGLLALRDGWLVGVVVGVMVGLGVMLAVPASRGSRTWVGAVGFGLVFFVLLMPVSCVGSSHPSSWSCSGVAGSLPGYDGRGRIDPSYTAPIAAASLAGAAYWRLVRRRETGRGSRPLV